MDISTIAGPMSLYMSPVVIYIHVFPSTSGLFKTNFLKFCVQQAHIGAMFECLQAIWCK